MASIDINTGGDEYGLHLAWREGRDFDLTGRFGDWQVAADRGDVGAEVGGTLTIISQFELGSSKVGLAFDPYRDELLAYTGGSVVERYDLTGALLGSFDNPGENANDYDLDLLADGIVMAGVEVPAGSTLVFNGETGVVEIYAVDSITGTVIATLITAFGLSHVVGGAWHPQRGTFFVLQDQLGSPQNNTIAEIDADTGAVLNSFRVDTAATDGFSVNFGDMEAIR